MRRKIIKQGNNSYTLTLPISWIRERKLDSGGEVEMHQEDNNLYISLPTDVRRTKNEIQVDANDFNERTMRNILNQFYRKGYDKIQITSVTREQLEDIRKITKNTLLGFEVTHESSSECTVQKVAEPSGDSFDAILRKIFLYILDDSQQILEEFTKKNLEGLKEKTRNKEAIDDYTNLCRRLIIEEKIGGTKNSYFLFSIVSRLSLIYHAYYYLYKFVTSQKNLSLEAESLNFLKNTNEMFTLFYEAFYRKDINKAHKLGTLKDKLIYGDFYSLVQKKKGPENVALHHVAEIVRLIHMQSTNLFGLIG